jgi:hypothetical protein
MSNSRVGGIFQLLAARLRNEARGAWVVKVQSREIAAALAWNCLFD